MDDTSRSSQEGKTEQKIAALEITKLRGEMKQLSEDIQKAETSVAVKLTAEMVLLASELTMLTNIIHALDITELRRMLKELQIGNAKPL